ncbi:unnamed protein product [Linum trigynum]|uniref:Uncharacterized protein n=1 Tax=Linum trigynum TaxID=586398 RepID=A0AAV2D415_9ROSI
MKAYLHALQLVREMMGYPLNLYFYSFLHHVALDSLVNAYRKESSSLILCTTTLNNIPSSSSTTHESQIKSQLESMELGDVVVEHVSSGDDDLGLKKYSLHLELLGLLDVNPIGSMIVGHNLDKMKGRGGYKGGCSSFGEALGRNKEGCYFVSLPIGDGGMELARLGGGGCCGNVPVEIERRYKRFHVTFEE